MRESPRPVTSLYGARLGTEPLSRMSVCMERSASKVRTAMVTVALRSKSRQYMQYRIETIIHPAIQILGQVSAVHLDHRCK